MIQNYSVNNTDSESYDLFFVLDTCNNIKGATNQDDSSCKTEDESQAIIEKMYIDTKIQTNFWNSKNFLRNAKNMNSEFTH